MNKIQRQKAWECGLPAYLQHDLDAYKEGLRSGSTLIDCLWCELYGSINGAEIDDQAITHVYLNPVVIDGQWYLTLRDLKAEGVENVYEK